MDITREPLILRRSRLPGPHRLLQTFKNFFLENGPTKDKIPSFGNYILPVPCSKIFAREKTNRFFSAFEGPPIRMLAIKCQAERIISDIKIASRRLAKDASTALFP